MLTRPGHDEAEIIRHWGRYQARLAYTLVSRCRPGWGLNITALCLYL